MGSLLDRIREDEDEYFWICQKLNISTLDYDNMYQHYPVIFKQFGVKDKSGLIDLIEKIEERSKKIDKLGI